MIDPSIIDTRIAAARQRDLAVCEALKAECARLVVVKPYHESHRTFSLDGLASTIGPARYHDSSAGGAWQPPPDAGSFAIQLYSAIMFAVDARAELRLLELIASPDFYSSLMRSAAEVQP